MQLKVFTLRWQGEGGFDDAALAGFSESVEVLSVAEHFFVHAGEPVWAVMVTYRPPHPGRARRKGRGERPESQLSAEDRALFERLRAWRGQRAKEDGVPPYLVLTNRQMAELARDKADSLSALGGIEGIGEGKLKKYGDQILALVAESPAREGPNDDQ